LTNFEFVQCREMSERGAVAGESGNSTGTKAVFKDRFTRINLSGDSWLSIDEIPGMYYRGIQYFDFRKISYINYNGLAHLVKFLKFFLEKGTEVHLVNVSESIKNKINAVGLNHVVHYR
jgi:ABC-type transporter Mla MlaB component